LYEVQRGKLRIVQVGLMNLLGRLVKHR
jgi:hypothetical protein